MVMMMMTMVVNWNHWTVFISKDYMSCPQCQHLSRNVEQSFALCRDIKLRRMREDAPLSIGSSCQQKWQSWCTLNTAFSVLNKILEILNRGAPVKQNTLYFMKLNYLWKITYFMKSRPILWKTGPILWKNRPILWKTRPMLWKTGPIWWKLDLFYEKLDLFNETQIWKDWFQPKQACQLASLPQPHQPHQSYRDVANCRELEYWSK